MAATIRDIKKMTGLSLATVSKYLNGGNVLPENRIKIEEAIKELHYEVNEVARGLAKNQTKTIGVLIHHLDNIFASTIIAYIEDILRQHEYGTIICDCRGDKELEEEEIKFLLGKRVDGIITIPTASNADYLKQAVARGIPIVLIDRAFDENQFDYVLVDNMNASYQAVSTLFQKGHKQVGIICGSDKEYTARERLGGYIKALEDFNITIVNEYIERGELTVEHGYNGMKRLLSTENKPTAVYLSNYEITLGAIIATNELGIKIPEELSIIGFDNIMLSQVVKPKPWMIVQPMEEIAKEAARIMLGRLDGSLGDEPVHAKLETSILTGESILSI